jgi:hypothetical protein
VNSKKSSAKGRLAHLYQQNESAIAAVLNMAMSQQASQRIFRQLAVSDPVAMIAKLARWR